MNYYQLQLYTELMALVESNEAFFYVDRVLDDKTYRLFNYRLASYTNFLQPGALECRGVMFDVTDEAEVRLVSLPMEKFFNLYENPMTMDLDLTKVVAVEAKADGSLISTFIHNGELRLKSKGALESEQAIAAMAYLEREDQAEFKMALFYITSMGFTINMEYCGPANRIVIGYMEPVLTVLNVRFTSDGTYVDVFSAPILHDEMWDPIRNAYIERLDIQDPVQFVSAIPDMEGIEGYIIRLDSGQRIKIKTLWYLTQHRAKDSINSDRRLFEAVLAESSDDLRTLFHDDPLVIQRIEWMEGLVEGWYNHLVDTVERFYERNKHMERKDYAILGQQELESLHFGLAMNKYVGKAVNYKDIMATKWREFGLTDVERSE